MAVLEKTRDGIWVCQMLSPAPGEVERQRLALRNAVEQHRAVTRQREHQHQHHAIEQRQAVARLCERQRQALVHAQQVTAPMCTPGRSWSLTGVDRAR